MFDSFFFYNMHEMRKNVYVENICCEWEDKFNDKDIYFHTAAKFDF